MEKQHEKKNENARIQKMEIKNKIKNIHGKHKTAPYASKSRNAPLAYATFAIKSISMLQPLARLGGAKPPKGQPLTLRLSHKAPLARRGTRGPFGRQSPCT